ncbi:MAG: hypothetical protein HZA53_11615 [Planctomycetes bacterium]|nr:hypothetical protein [Planctomycetota bacterium]
MSRRFQLLSLVFAASLAARSSAQTTWYVDVNATPPGSGTLASPYTDLQNAHDQASTVDYDTILVAPGTYVDDFAFSKRVTIRTTGGAEVTTLRSTGAAAATLSLNAPLDELDVLVVEGFTITGHVAPATQGVVRSGEGTLVRCIVRDNVGIGVETTYDTVLVDCTIVNNTYGIECSTLSDAIWMKNCIVWGNGVNHLSGPQPIGSDIRYCAGGPFYFASGPGNLTGDPGMWNVSGGDFRLRPGSPCVDAGDPALLDPDLSRSDIGYYAYDGGYAPITIYCVGKLNSQGCVPQIAGSGLPSLTNPAPFLITATLVPPGKRGVLFYSHTQDAQPFEGGTFCIGPFRRAGGQTSQGAGPCGGVFSYNFNVRVQSGADPTLLPGELVYAQWWHRDPNDPAGYQSGLTNALCFGIVP